MKTKTDINFFCSPNKAKSIRFSCILKVRVNRRPHCNAIPIHFIRRADRPRLLNEWVRILTIKSLRFHYWVNLRFLEIFFSADFICQFFFFLRKRLVVLSKVYVDLIKREYLELITSNEILGCSCKSRNSFDLTPESNRYMNSEVSSFDLRSSKLWYRILVSKRATDNKIRSRFTSSLGHWQCIFRRVISVSLFLFLDKGHWRPNQYWVLLKRKCICR